jgi:hypothetical protein
LALTCVGANTITSDSTIAKIKNGDANLNSFAFVIFSPPARVFACLSGLPTLYIIFYSDGLRKLDLC